MNLLVAKFPIFERQRPKFFIGIINIIIKLNIEHSERVIVLQKLAALKIRIF